MWCRRVNLARWRCKSRCQCDTRQTLPTSTTARSVQIKLIDDAALDAWKDVVIELEGPRKNVATFGLSRSPDAPKPLNHLKRWHFWPRGGFGMPGTVLHEDGKFRAWLGQSTQRYFESTDGLHFDQPVNPQTGQIREVQWSPLSARGRSQMGEHGASFQSPREVAQDTFTLMRDDSMPDRSASSERYKAALTCDDLGHTPYPKFREHRRMGRISRTVWTRHPSFVGSGIVVTCLAHSRDGFRWRLYDLGHHRAKGPEPLRLAATPQTRCTAISSRATSASSIAGPLRCPRQVRQGGQPKPVA